MRTIFKNWKTTAAALVTLVSVGLPAIGVIDAGQAAAISTLAQVFGFAFAKDGDQTGK